MVLRSRVKLVKTARFSPEIVHRRLDISKNP